VSTPAFDLKPKHYLVCTECPKQPFLAVVKTEMSKGWPGVFAELSRQTKWGAFRQTSVSEIDKLVKIGLHSFHTLHVKYVCNFLAKPEDDRLQQTSDYFVVSDL